MIARSWKTGAFARQPVAPSIGLLGRRPRRVNGHGVLAGMNLDHETIEAIARRVAELVGPKPATRLLDAAELAEELNVSTAFVYRHATRLGARRLGTGPKARLRFDLQRARSALTDSRVSTPSPAGPPVDVPRAARRKTAPPPIRPRTKGRPGAVR